MATEKKVFEVQIAGLTFKLKTSHDEQVVKELVNFANQKIEDCLRISKNSSLQNASVLAVLNLAEELFLLRKQALSELDRIEKKAHRISQNLEDFPLSQ